MHDCSFLGYTLIKQQNQLESVSDGKRGIMWGIILALISGALMSIQGVFNTEVTKQTSLWVSTGFVQLGTFGKLTKRTVRVRPRPPLLMN